VAQKQVARSELSLKLERIAVVASSLFSFWDVYQFKKASEAYEDLLNVVKTRQSWIERKVSAGSLARLVAEENEKSILLAEENLIRFNNRLQVAKNRLKVFLYDVDHWNKSLSLPKDFKPQEPSITSLSMERQWLKNHPVLQDLEEALAQENIRLNLAKNDLLPNLDLEFEQTDPQGEGSLSLTEPERRIGATLKIPIFLSEARGEKRVAQRQIEVLKNRLELARRDLLRDFENAVDSLNQTTRQVGLLRRQVEIDQRLRKAEETLFRQGSSNMINLIIRDRNLLESQIKLIEAEVTAQKLLVDLVAIRGQDQFMP
jgi:outer membrane protein TolC